MQCGKRTLSAVMFAAGLLAGLPQASAQSTYNGLKPSWYLIPQVSAFDPDNSYGVKGTGVGGGIAIGTPLTSDWDVQMLVSHARRSEAGNKIQQTLLGADAVYYFSRSEWRPYFLLGAGAENDRRTSAALGNVRGTSPYISAAVGLRYMFSDSLGLQGEYRRVEGFLSDSSKWGFSHSGSNYVNLGLLWNFDVEKPRPAAPKVVAAPVVVAPPPPPPKPREAAPPPPPAPTVQTITLDATRLFELNSARLALPVPELDGFASALQANPQVTSVMISGHTDQLGKAAYNQGLSQKRADAVKAYLVTKGIAANRLTAQGKGSTQLVTDCREKTRAAMIKCGAPNRRVVIEPITVPKR